MNNYYYYVGRWTYIDGENTRSFEIRKHKNDFGYAYEESHTIGTIYKELMEVIVSGNIWLEARLNMITLRVHYDMYSKQIKRREKESGETNFGDIAICERWVAFLQYFRVAFLKV